MKTTILIFLILIAFNTNSTATDIPGKEFYLEDEEYVDDIPFDTHKIAANYMMEEAMSIEFSMDEEETINDLPFDTKEVAQKLKNTKCNKELLDLIQPMDNSREASKTDISQVQTSSISSFRTVGILWIILMSTYSVAAFLL